MMMQQRSHAPPSSAQSSSGTLRPPSGRATIRRPALQRSMRAAAAAPEKATSTATTSNASLDNLDALLGGQGVVDPDAQLVPWWQLKPRQSAPPRQALLHPPGEVARFVTDQAMYATKLRSGRSTQVGGELDLPQVEPYFCYVIMAAQLAVYGAGTWLAVSQGPAAAEAMARELALQPAAVLEEGQSWRLATSCLLHGGLTHLALDSFLLGWTGPGIEALLGHSTFLSIYSLSGLAGAVAVLLFSDTIDPTACSTAATLGLIGSMLGYELANSAIVRQSLKSRTSMAEDGKRGSSQLRKPWGALGVCVLLLGLGFMPGSMVDNASHVGGLLAGVALGYGMGPKFSLIQEIDIPVGSMTVPDDAPATIVVLDRRTGLSRALAGAGAAGLLAALLVVGGAAKHALG